MADKDLPEIKLFFLKCEFHVKFKLLSKIANYLLGEKIVKFVQCVPGESILSFYYESIDSPGIYCIYLSASIMKLLEIMLVSIDVSHTRKSLVKGERFIRNEWKI